MIYQNEDTGYAVLRIEASDASILTAVGCIPFPAPGEDVIADGKWVSHPSHGNQFSIARVERLLPSGTGAILDYLSSGVIKGIGKATAKLIVGHFGENSLKILENEPHRLSEVRGLTERRAKRIGEEFTRQTGLRRLMEFLAGHGISPLAAVRLLSRYGSQAMERVKNDYYILADEIYGVPFSSVDTMALSEGISEDSPQRCRAAVLFELVYNLGVGHVYIPKDKLIEACVDLIGVSAEAVMRGLDELTRQGRIIISGEDSCYLDYVLEAEAFVSHMILRLCAVQEDKPVKFDKIIERIEKRSGLTYAQAQKNAVAMAAHNRIMLLTGGPGTGKTTTVKALLELYAELGLDVLLAAPTGRAAKRLSELTGREAKTLHRMLEFGFDPAGNDMRFLRDEENPLETDVVIVDETSMVDILLMYRLMLALPDGARIVFVGDADQLPSVGPGNVFGDMLASERIPAIALTEIFRQAQQSRIIVGAHSVNSGELPSLRNQEGDMFFLRRPEARSAVDTVAELCSERLPKGLGLESSQIQVLTPSRKGVGGTVNLNRVLQGALNPAQHHKLEKRFGDMLFREGDRVMQVKNDYDLAWSTENGTRGMGVFNGEVGVIRDIQVKEERVTVVFDDKIVIYGPDNLSELEPAFAMTIHKSQGSEYPAVILVLTDSPKPLMTRRVLYTGMTRARDWLILVGDERVIAEMVYNNRRGKRYSGLKNFIINGIEI